MKTVFISGATSGIGLHTAQRMDMLGWRVYAAALPQADFAPLVESTSDALTPLLLDITDAQAVADAAAHIQREAGALTGVVNNAGIQLPGVMEGQSMQRLRQQFEVNVFGHVQVTQALSPLLRESENARLVFVTSLMGRVAMPTLGAYSMTKHALEGLVDVLRLELAAFDIHVAAVEPGAVQTPMLDAMPNLMHEARAHTPDDLQPLYAPLYDSMESALQQQAATATPVEEVADAIVHALTDDNPKTRYAVGLPIRGLIAMRQLAPDTIGDAILRRALELPKS